MISLHQVRIDAVLVEGLVNMINFHIDSLGRA